MDDGTVKFGDQVHIGTEWGRLEIDGPSHGQPDEIRFGIGGGFARQGATPVDIVFDSRKTGSGGSNVGHVRLNGAKFMGGGSSHPTLGTIEDSSIFFRTDKRSFDVYNSGFWKTSPFNVLLDDEIHFWDLATDPGNCAAQGRVNVAVAATGCTTTMVYFGWITSTLGLELGGANVETGTDFAQHFCTANGTLTHVFYNRDSVNASDRRSASSQTMGVDWS